MKFRFPRTRFVTDNTFRQQVEHVISEAKELLTAIDDIEGSDRVIEESLDLVHSTETLLRKLQEQFSSVIVNEARLDIIRKNSARNYYGYTSTELAMVENENGGMYP